MATRDEWLRVIRRAFGVPDIVGHDVARFATARALLQAAEAAWSAPPPWLAAPETAAAEGVKVVDALAEQGAEGTLDAWLCGMADLASVVTATANRSRGVEAEHQPLLEAGLQQILTFVASHPFHDDAGRIMQL